MQLIQKKLDNISEWIKEYDEDRHNIKHSIIDMQQVISENTDNIEHNYELLLELRDTIEDLNMDINALKLIQIITAKKREE